MTTKTPPKGGPVWHLCWAKALELNEFNTFQLAAAVGYSQEPVRLLIKEWETSGVVENLGKQPPKNRTLFRVIPGKTPPEMAREGLRALETPHRNMWTAMRGLKTFQPMDVAAHASTEVTSVTEADAAEYCRLLTRAGYLKPVRKAVPGRSSAVYRLIKDTGPKPPRERRVRAVYDDNLQSFAHIPGVEE